jgi:hypothetical protein
MLLRVSLFVLDRVTQHICTSRSNQWRRAESAHTSDLPIELTGIGEKVRDVQLRGR